MGSVRIPLYAAGVAAALFALAGPVAAVPGQGEDVRLTPSAATPGGDVDIRTQSCGRAVTGTVSSRAFVSTVRLAPAADGGLFAEAVVSSSATPGSYPVSINCDGLSRAAQGTLTVTRSGKQGGEGSGGEKQWGGGETGSNGGGGGGQENQWGGGGSGDQDKEKDKDWGAWPSTPIAPVPAGGGGTAKLVAGEGQQQGQKPRETGVPAVVAAGVLAVAGVAGLAVHRRRRGRDQD